MVELIFVLAWPVWRASGLGLGGGGAPKAPPPPPPPPQVEDKAIQDAAAAAALRRKNARGYRSTILSDLTADNPGLKATLGS